MPHRAFRTLALAALLTGCSTAPEHVAEKPPSFTSPSPAQLGLHERGYGMLVRFGPETFVENGVSDGKQSVSIFNPSSLDCDRWAAVAKEAGFRHLVLEAKADDGFCLWPTATTAYGVSGAPVKTDIVGAVAKACTKYGLGFGLGFSLRDLNHPAFADRNSARYAEVVKSRLTELLTNYGTVLELRLEGAGARPAKDWDLAGLRDLVKRLQPDCLVSVDSGIGSPANPEVPVAPENQTEGAPVRYWPMDFRTADSGFAGRADPKLFTTPDGLRYLPLEQTVTLSDHGNFFQKTADIPARSTDELETLFHRGTSQGNSLLVNVAPGRDGRFRAHEVRRLYELADRLGIRGGATPLPAPVRDRLLGSVVTAVGSLPTRPPNFAHDAFAGTSWSTGKDTGTLSFALKYPVAIDRITLEEAASERKSGDGSAIFRDYAVRSFVVEADTDRGDRLTLFAGDSIGAARVIVLDKPVVVRNLRIVIRGASGAFGLSDVRAGLGGDREPRD